MRAIAFCLLLLAAPLPACHPIIESGGSFGGGGAGGASSSSSSSSSSQSASTGASSTGAGVTCDTAFRGIGAACSVEGLLCPVPHACCKAEAHCKYGVWEINTLNCVPNDCGPPCSPQGFACVTGAVCVAYAGATTAYQCHEDLCAGALDCSCAAAYCQEQSMMCATVQQGFMVLCQ